MVRLGSVRPRGRGPARGMSGPNLQDVCVAWVSPSLRYQKYPRGHSDTHERTQRGAPAMHPLYHLLAP